MRIRVLYNVILCRLGIRQLLPKDFINAIEIVECGEKLVEFQGIKVRESVAEKLRRVESNLSLMSYGIQVVSGYRTLEEQLTLWQNAAGNRKFSADPTTGKGGGHQTGGAVDILLLKNGETVDMGSNYCDHNNRSITFPKNKGIITSEQLFQRQILYNAMIAEGFINYPGEWWHYCYGDQMWAAYSQKNKAMYGSIAGKEEL